MQSILRAQKLSEDQASSYGPTRNRLVAGALADLLGERNKLTSKDQLTRLASQYDMDVEVLEKIAETVNECR